MKTCVCFLAVKADAKDPGVFGFKLRHQAAEPAAFNGSARRSRLGIKPKHDKLPEVVPERVFHASVVA